MSNSDRPPAPAVTPEQGYLRAGLVYVDDSPIARELMRRALYAHAVLLEAYDSLESLRARPPSHPPIVAALLDMDLGEGVSGLDVSHEIRRAFPEARIAFVTAEISPDRRRLLAPHGPVFDKLGEVDTAKQWLLDCARGAASSVGRSR